MDVFEHAIKQLTSDRWVERNNIGFVSHMVTDFGWVTGVGPTRATAEADAEKKGRELKAKWMTSHG